MKRLPGKVRFTNRDLAAVSDGRLTEPEFIQKLKIAGFEEYEIELLMVRYWEGKSMKEVVAEQNWLHLQSANYYLKKVLKILRERKFKIND